MKSKTALFLLALVVWQGSASANSLSAFNLLASDQINLFNAHVEGRIGAVGTVHLHKISVGTKLWSDPFRCDVTGMASIDATETSVPNGAYCSSGHVALHSSSALAKSALSPKDGLHRLAADNAALSERLGWYSLTSSPKHDGGILTFATHRRGLSVFEIPAGTLESVGEVRVSAPYGATVLIRVKGYHLNIVKKGMNVSGGISHSSVLLHLPEAESIYMDSARVLASILAPRARLEFHKGQIQGSVAVESAAGNGTYLNVPFTGSL